MRSARLRLPSSINFPIKRLTFLLLNFASGSSVRRIALFRLGKALPPFFCVQTNSMATHLRASYTSFFCYLANSSLSVPNIAKLERKETNLLTSLEVSKIADITKGVASTTNLRLWFLTDAYIRVPIHLHMMFRGRNMSRGEHSLLVTSRKERHEARALSFFSDEPFFRPA